MYTSIYTQGIKVDIHIYNFTAFKSIFTTIATYSESDFNVCANNEIFPWDRWVMGTSPSALSGWNNPEGERLQEAVETVGAHACVTIVFSASIDKSGQVPDEKIVELAFAV